ncbi:squamosa promoter-binding-like protein 12, partial [Tanacetum coccineum]
YGVEHKVGLGKTLLRSGPKGLQVPRSYKQQIRESDRDKTLKDRLISQACSVEVNAPINCQVMEYDRDLAFAKDYHRKHRVCDIHSKSLKVIVAGLERRFHGLPEFDGKKQSCRKRLADHNARRRPALLVRVGVGFHITDG